MRRRTRPYDTFTVGDFDASPGSSTVRVPDKPWRLVLFVSREYLAEGRIAARPLTLAAFFGAVCTNFAVMTYWRFCWCLAWVGLFDTPDGAYHGFRYWRWAFWKSTRPQHRRRRRQEAATRKLSGAVASTLLDALAPVPVPPSQADALVAQLDAVVKKGEVAP